MSDQTQEERVKAFAKQITEIYVNSAGFCGEELTIARLHVAAIEKLEQEIERLGKVLAKVSTDTSALISQLGTDKARLELENKGLVEKVERVNGFREELRSKARPWKDLADEAAVLIPEFVASNNTLTAELTTMRNQFTQLANAAKALCRTDPECDNSILDWLRAELEKIIPDKPC